MIESLAAATTLACLLLAVAVAALTLAGRYRWRRVAAGLAAIEAALLLDAVADIVGLVRGHHPGEPGTHLAYLVTSLVVLPVAGMQVVGDDGRWSASLVIVALLVLAVVVVRAQTTWRAL